MIDNDALDHIHKPTLNRPLLGLTVLAVEDSKFACDAVRLMCLHSGARLRRADCLKSARRHLQVYRPSVVIVDMGLPDGSGAELVSELSRAAPRVGVLLATSGDSFAEDVAYAAGADGFLAKPIANLGVFQNAIIQHLPDDQQPYRLRTVSNQTFQPDPIAFREDMAHMAEILDGPVDNRMADYIALFLRGVARTAEDAVLERAASELADARANGTPLGGQVMRLAGLIDARLQDTVAI
ncbi:response regulator [Marivita hallyeonensis]|uniref:Response regulator receiver domain-containing protein n=1 Tax=Marivita hallyeonensis TaxID=996342 RepID=A0A1M5ULT2_9RHOB|nr:response regulator [Marivita hallyeonensis]SHH63673.1 Response regulator receiver domain-containing protein [Marivita hallyeonensis]